MNDSQRTMQALLTYEDYCQIPSDENRYEVIDGALFMSPSPVERHQRIFINLIIRLGPFVEESGLGRLYGAPFDVILSDHNVVQPDLLFVSKERLSIITEKNVQGAPDLLIEILSESNRRQDEVVKRKVYESHGVQEYWVVDPVLEIVKVYRLKEGKYEKAEELRQGTQDMVPTPLLPGFACRVADVFAE